MLLAAIFTAVQFASLFTPPLLDDADASHAQAAQHMAESWDWVTLKVNGIRYLEKPPLPYWLDAGLYRIFGQNAFATHLPNALALLGCAWLGWLWARRAWGDRAGLYAGLAILTSIGPFLFTRFAIPEALLSFLFLLALYCLMTGLEAGISVRIYGMWAALALATLTKGLIAPVFFAAAAIPLLLLTGQWRRWRDLNPFSGLLLFLAIAAPWHILAGIANPDQATPSGTTPPWAMSTASTTSTFSTSTSSAFWAIAFRMTITACLLPPTGCCTWSGSFPGACSCRRWWWWPGRPVTTGCSTCATTLARRSISTWTTPPARMWPSYVLRLKFRVRSIWLLSLFAGFILVFFSISTNQEYYTFPAWPPLLILAAGMLAGIEENRSPSSGKSLLSTAWLTGAHAVFTVAGALAAVGLGWGLWESRHLPYVSDIGTLLAHRDVGDYTLSMSHIFDLTGPSFAALRLPAALAAITLLIGPAIGLVLRLKKKHLAATVSLALTSAIFLIAAHIAFARFEPMLSSKQLADTIVQRGSSADSLIIYGDQSDASSVVFYTHKFLGKPALLVVEQCSPMGTAPLCCGDPATPTRPRSSSATISFPRPGARANASGFSPKTPTSPRPNRSWRAASTRSNPSPTKRCGPTVRCSRSMLQ